MRIAIEIRPGELADRISILRLKVAHGSDSDIATVLRQDLRDLEALARGLLDKTGAVERHVERLAEINSALWELENDVRRHLETHSTGTAFADCATRIFKLNEQRSNEKAAIDRLTMGATAEAKFFA